MEQSDLGRLLRRRMSELKISQGRLGVRIGELPDGRVYDATGIRNLLRGRRKVDPMLLERLIDVLELDPDEAYHALGWWPAGLTLEDVLEYRRRKADHEAWIAAGQPDRRQDRRGDRRQEPTDLTDRRQRSRRRRGTLPVSAVS